MSTKVKMSVKLLAKNGKSNVDGQLKLVDGGSLEFKTLKSIMKISANCIYGIQVKAGSSDVFVLYVLHRQRGDKKPLHVKHEFSAMINSQNTSSLDWVKQINAHVFGVHPARRVLVLINPAGGKKKAMRIYQKYCQPILTLSGSVQVTLKVTEYARHAVDIGKSLAVHGSDKFDAVVTVSGDGLFHELVNGLMDRSDWQQAIQIPLGIIPAGSGNALAKSIDVAHPSMAALSILHGHVKPMDLYAHKVLNSPVPEVKFGFLEIMWALVADIDLESEYMRWAGPARFTLTAIQRVMKLRQYRGHLTYMPYLDTHPETVEMDGVKHDKPVLQYINDVNADSQPEGWSIVDADFTYFMAMNVTHCSTDFLVAPNAQLSDGTLDLVWVESGNRTQMLKILLDTESGAYVKEPWTRQCKCRAFILSPDTVHGRRKGNMDVDGELVPYSPIAVEVLSSYARLIVPKDELK